MPEGIQRALQHTDPEIQELQGPNRGGSCSPTGSTEGPEDSRVGGTEMPSSSVRFLRGHSGSSKYRECPRYNHGSCSLQASKGAGNWGPNAIVQVLAVIFTNYILVSQLLDLFSPAFLFL